MNALFSSWLLKLERFLQNHRFSHVLDPHQPLWIDTIAYKSLDIRNTHLLSPLSRCAPSTHANTFDWSK